MVTQQLVSWLGKLSPLFLTCWACLVGNARRIPACARALDSSSPEEFEAARVALGPENHPSLRDILLQAASARSHPPAAIAQKSHAQAVTGAGAGGDSRRGAQPSTL